MTLDTDRSNARGTRRWTSSSSAPGRPGSLWPPSSGIRRAVLAHRPPARPRPPVTALAIQPRTLEVLAHHDVTRHLLDRGNPSVQLRMHLGRRTVSLRLFDLGLADTAYPYLLFVSQAETDSPTWRSTGWRPTRRTPT
jgi:hypothetical protein